MLSARLSVFCFSLVVALAVYTGSANAQTSGPGTLCSRSLGTFALFAPETARKLGMTDEEVLRELMELIRA